MPLIGNICRCKVEVGCALSAKSLGENIHSWFKGNAMFYLWEIKVIGALSPDYCIVLGAFTNCFSDS